MRREGLSSLIVLRNIRMAPHWTNTKPVAAYLSVIGALHRILSDIRLSDSTAERGISWWLDSEAPYLRYPDIPYMNLSFKLTSRCLSFIPIAQCKVHPNYSTKRKIPGSCHKRQKPQAPTPQTPIHNRQTKKKSHKGLNRNTNLI